VKWERDGTWWVAKGKDGAFFVRRKNYSWIAHYLTYKNRHVIWLTKSKTAAEAKRKCEYNIRWESNFVKKV